MKGSNPKPAAMRIIGIDFGIARIGISVSDETKLIAMPLVTLKTEKKTEATVASLIKTLDLHSLQHHYEIQEIVVGLPLLMNGKVGFLADETRNFIEILQKSIACPIITWDERLTTVQADRSLRESNFSRKKRAKFVDTVAAVIILQNYLDHKRLQGAL